LDQGHAWDRFCAMVRAQGGSVDDLNPDRPWCTHYKPSMVTAHTSGYIVAWNARSIGDVAVDLGAGRRQSSDAVDPHAGIVLHKKVGMAVHQGDVLAHVYGKHSERAVAAVQTAVTIAAEPPPLTHVITHQVTSEHGCVEFTLPASFLALM
jgi:pyrimidine-nucleoside phosphorylase